MKSIFYFLIRGLFICFFALLFSCQDTANDMSSNVDDVSTNQVQASDQIINEEERHRPKFHFTPNERWMNDPNGMVFYADEYHLFYQYYPDDIVWGPMHWGHAVSKDLVIWEHLPIALFPDEKGYIFSGSAVIDWNNTSGFGEEIEGELRPAMVAIFTHHDPEKAKVEKVDVESQSIAYSLDKGRTWIKYDHNPVLPNPGIRDFRDPKVIWYDKGKKWIMVLAAQDRAQFYASEDLKAWKYLSDFGKDLGAHKGVWECPDFFPINVEGSNEEKWVLLQSLNPGGPNGGSGTQYFVGDFNGTEFKLDAKFKNSVQPIPGKKPDGRVFENFESMSYDTWQKDGFAMGNGPLKGGTHPSHKILGKEGERAVNSKFGNEEPTGTLTSPTFIIEKPFINFKIGGGNLPGKVGMKIFVEGEQIYETTGNKSNKLGWKHWDVSDYIGQSAKMIIFDNESKEWGFILVDQIEFADEPASEIVEQAHWIDYGRDNYAGVTWSDVPKEDGRRIFIGWMSNWMYAGKVPTKKWRSSMTIPRTLHLEKSIDFGYKLRSQPAKELVSLREEEVSIKDQTISDELNLSTLFKGDAIVGEIDLTIAELNGKNSFGFRLLNDHKDVLEFGLNKKSNKWYIDRSGVENHSFEHSFANKKSIAPFTENSEGKHSIQIFIDVASIEVFIDNGETVMTEIFFPIPDFNQLRLFVHEGSVDISEVKIYTY